MGIPYFFILFGQWVVNFQTFEDFVSTEFFKLHFTFPKEFLDELCFGKNSTLPLSFDHWAKKIIHFAWKFRRVVKTAFYNSNKKFWKKNRFLTQKIMFLLLIFGLWAEKRNNPTLWHQNFGWVIKTAFQVSVGSFWGKKRFEKKIPFFSHLLILKEHFVAFCRAKSVGINKIDFYVVCKTFEEKTLFFGRKYIFSILLRLSAKYFLPLQRNILTGLSKMPNRCRKVYFEGKNEKTTPFLNFWLLSENWLAFRRFFFRWGCQNLSLRLHVNCLTNNSFFRRITFFYHFQSISDEISAHHWIYFDGCVKTAFYVSREFFWRRLFPQNMYFFSQFLTSSETIPVFFWEICGGSSNLYSRRVSEHFGDYLYFYGKSAFYLIFKQWMKTFVLTACKTLGALSKLRSIFTKTILRKNIFFFEKKIPSFSELSEKFTTPCQKSFGRFFKTSS